MVTIARMSFSTSTPNDKGQGDRGIHEAIRRDFRQLGIELDESIEADPDGSPPYRPTSPTYLPRARGIRLAAERDSAYEGLTSADAIYAEPDDSPGYTPTSPTYAPGNPPISGVSRLSINNDDDDVDPSDGNFRSYLKRLRSPTPPRPQPTFSDDENVVDNEDVTVAGIESDPGYTPTSPPNSPPHPLDQTTHYDLYNRDDNFVDLMKAAYKLWLMGDALDKNGKPRRIIKFKIKIGGVDFYLIFFTYRDPDDPKIRGTMARIFLNDTENPLDKNYIISCEIRTFEVYLAHFFYTSSRDQAKAVKPSPTVFMKNLLQRYFEIPEEKIAALKLNDGDIINLDDIFEKVNEIRGGMGKPLIGPLQFYYVVDITKHFPSTGQRGMRLVKLIKEITEKVDVTLYDAWVGQWGETSEDLKFIHEYLTKRDAVIEALRNIDTRNSNVLGEYYRARDKWEDFTTNTTGKVNLLTPKLLQHYEKRFKTTSGRYMIYDGYYGQFGFIPQSPSDKRNLVSQMESGEVTQLEFKEFPPQDDSTVRVLVVQSRFRTR